MTVQQARAIKEAIDKMEVQVKKAYLEAKIRKQFNAMLSASIIACRNKIMDILAEEK